MVPLPPSPPYPGFSYPFPPFLQSYFLVESPSAEVMTEKDLEKYWEIHNSIVDYICALASENRPYR